MAPETMMKIAIFDDYQNGALQMADWTAIPKRAEVTVFNHHLSDPDAVVRRLRKPTAEAIVRFDAILKVFSMPIRHVRCWRHRSGLFKSP
jgi:hypothetical protein